MPSGTILVTGGSGGIGRAIVETLVAAGTQVVFTYRNDEAGATALVSASEGRARALHLDLGDAVAIDSLVNRIEDESGPLDGLVNNAGIQVQGLLPMLSAGDWSRIVETNLAGPFRCCGAVLPGMLRRRRGAIVNIASLSALRGVAGLTAYSASKAGLLGMTRALAREVGKRGIRVNAVVPGFVATGMTADLSEVEVSALRAAECLPGGVDVRCVAETVCFLLSSKARSITGQCWVVDAGVSA